MKHGFRKRVTQKRTWGKKVTPFIHVNTRGCEPMDEKTAIALKALFEAAYKILAKEYGHSRRKRGGKL